MKLVPDILPQGRKDILEICDYLYESDRFLQQLDETIDLLCDFPDSGEQFRPDPSGKTRRCTVFNFKNYVIYFRQENETLQIIRVVHGARDDKTLFSPPQS